MQHDAHINHMLQTAYLTGPHLGQYNIVVNGSNGIISKALRLRALRYPLELRGQHCAESAATVTACSVLIYHPEAYNAPHCKITLPVELMNFSDASVAKGPAVGLTLHSACMVNTSVFSSDGTLPVSAYRSYQ